MKLLYSLISILLFLSCDSEKSNQNQSYNVNKPERPTNLTNNAKWYGGPDGGLWFILTKVDDKEYRIENYFENGTKHWVGIFIIEQKGFNIDEPYDFMDPSDFTRCTIRQKKNTFTFKKNNNIS